MQNLGGHALFHLFAVAQHLDPVRHLGHHSQVVGDVQRRRVVLANQRLEQDQHFNLRGHIQRGGGLVQHQHIRPAGHGHGSHGALQLAARHLVRIALAEVLGIRQIQSGKQLTSPGFRFRAGHQLVHQGRFAHLVHQTVRRVEGRCRRLRDIGHALATHRAPAFGVQCADIGSAQNHFAPGNVQTCAGVHHARQADGRLARTAFTDQTQHLAFAQLQVDVVHNHVARHALEAQALDIQNDLFVHTTVFLRVLPGHRRGARQSTASSPPPG